MSRARALSLALVNWKGVFYERYELDRHVTALEGKNGAGKTTVMIAAYIVLLPDMSRLRFTNLGETAPTGGDRGIWGRLGEPGRPAYAALEIDLGDGRRVVAGVLLQRKSEPSVELTPFLITELSNDVRLSALLLVVDDEHEAIPELSEIKASVLEAGAKIQVFASAKDYFAALFELGIGALRLSSDEDRARLGDMLRTSMTGGISRAITSELRSFLLKEQGSLGDTLGRMRDNLSACRRTRIEVGEARHLEQEISGIYDAGQSMFAASLRARREQARETHQNLVEAERLLGLAEASRDELSATLEATALREARVSEQLAGQRALSAELRDSAQKAKLREQARETRSVVEREREAALTSAQVARDAQAASVIARDTAKQSRSLAQQNYERAALGLANLEAGLDELHRRSSAWRKAARALTRARELLQNEQLEAADGARALFQQRARLSELDAARLNRARDLELAERSRNGWQTAHAALAGLGPVCDPEQAFAVARQELGRLEALEASLTRRSELEREHLECERLSLRQEKAQKAALGLGLELAPGSMLQRIETRLLAFESEAEEVARTELAHRERGHASKVARERLAEQIEAAEARHGSYLKACELRARVANHFEASFDDREGLLRVRDAIAEARRALEVRLAEGSALRERLLREATELEASGGRFPSELVRLKDELEGELFANRFEELEPSEAARLEALLGPLAHAIVVDDVERATQRVSGKPRQLAEVWLIAAGAELDILSREKPSEHAVDVCVTEGAACRITRIPEHATLGRKARKARLEELRRQADEAGAECEGAQVRLRALENTRKDVDSLLAHVELLKLGDPGLRAAELRVEAQVLEEAARADAERALVLDARASELRLQASALRRLLSEAFLLDAPPHAERARELAWALLQIDEAASELERVRTPRSELVRHLDALRCPPLGDEELSRLQEENASRMAERDRVFESIEVLSELVDQAPALAWEAAETAIKSQADVLPALEQQHQGARRAVEEAERLVQLAEADWEQKTAELQRREAELSVISAELERLERQASGSGLSPTSSAGALEQQAAELLLQTQELERKQRELLSERGRNTEKLSQARTDADRHRLELEGARRAAAPAENRWRAIASRAQAARLLHASAADERLTPASAIELFAEARSKRDLLRDRLATARGGDELSHELSRLSIDEDDRSFLELWLRVRDWLAHRVPAQVAEVDEPLEALERLRDRLSLLQQRLTHQEADLRGASEDVARGIEVQLRRAKSQVRRLNQNLSNVSFGSIAGIRVELRRVASMEPVLRALAEGAAQELLFQSSLPMEEALAEILRRFGGGGRGGGARVLDYREYIELLVEVQRKANGAWEPANPTRLSTGEAIGVGAALMMVVLAEWERDANLLRSRRGPGSLRFLFLDEANRLSQDNLSALFDLCETLDLQLLIAAPEVARSDHNTTYRLVRTVTEAGREEVLVSGRRKLEPAPAETPLAPRANEPAQTSLFELA